MQAQHGVEAVEQASKLDDVLGLDVVVVQAREQTAEAAHLVLDLGVRTAQRGGRVATECSVDDGDEDFFVGALVREQFAFEAFEYLECCGEVCVVGAQPVGNASDLFNDWQEGVVLLSNCTGSCGDAFRWHRNGVTLAGEDSAQRDEDRENVNDLLQDRAERWLKQAGSRGVSGCLCKRFVGSGATGWTLWRGRRSEEAGGGGG